jgi:hypothetical protein
MNTYYYYYYYYHHHVKISIPEKAPSYNTEKKNKPLEYHIFPLGFVLKKEKSPLSSVTPSPSSIAIVVDTHFFNEIQLVF